MKTLMRVRRVLWLALLLLLVPLARAQAQSGTAAAPLVFDAVTIKPNHSGVGGTSVSIRDSTFQATNISLKNLLMNAYGIREALISGLPGWADSDRFDVNAKVVDPDIKVFQNLSREQHRAMLIAMLEERFHLKAHIESKMLPIYEMVVGKDGVKFEESALPPVDPSKPGGAGGPGSVNSTKGEFTGNTIPLSPLTFQLSYLLGRPVVDKTGLTRKYNLHLKFTPDDAAQPLPDDAPPPLFLAIQEQLGLKLVSSKGPVDTLVVDSVERPIEN